MPKGTKRPYTAEQRRKSVEGKAKEAFAKSRELSDKVGKEGILNDVFNGIGSISKHREGQKLREKAKSMNQATGVKRDTQYMHGGKLEGFESPVKEKARKSGKDFPFFKHSTKGK